MPKIKLRHSKSGEVIEREPIDAREILATPGNEYTPDEDSATLLGAQYSAAPQGTAGMNLPQLQGGDEDLQTGLSVDKYGRSAVHKAVPSSGATAARPMDTTFRPLSLKEARKGGAPGQQPKIEEGGPLDNAARVREGGMPVVGGEYPGYQTSEEVRMGGAKGRGKANAPGQQGPESTQAGPGKSGEQGRGHSMERRAERASNRELEAQAEAKTVDELKADLDAKGVSYPSGALKADLVELWVEANKT